MLATKAKEIRDREKKAKHIACLTKHEEYAKYITDTKVKQAASKGLSTVTLKTSKRYNMGLLADKIRDLGYEVIVSSKDTKINW